MEKITEQQIAEAAKKFVKDGATLKEIKGVSNDELEAVYSLGFGYYQTGRFSDAQKLFEFLVLFDHLSAKYWFALGAVQQAQKDYQKAIASYGYSSFLDLENPKPQLHAAECYLALGDKENAASAIMALEQYAPQGTELGREYRAKAAELRKTIGEDAFEVEE
ncbi:MAG: SycD/LcrH family type III secretion system chaperone [Kiritimatiellae bacterium]|nr:SycD/LcrH family type III secretion system chaperone [Kiritimatiellia bacterium]